MRTVEHELPDNNIMSTLEMMGVNKVFSGGQGVHDASIKLTPQAIHGLIGANGSGKSTLLSLIAGLQFPGSGSIVYGGIPIQENAAILSQICLVKTYERTWEEYTIRDILNFGPLFYPNWDEELAEQLLSKFQLGARKKYKHLSRGAQSMAGIIKGLASRSPLTLLDEPANGLDASMRDIFYQALLEDYGQFPRTIVMATHLIDEAESLFEYIAYIKNGSIAYHGPTEQFAAKAAYATGPANLLEGLSQDKRTLHTERLGGRLLLALDDFADPAERKHWSDLGIELSPVPLQKFFVYKTRQDTGNNHEGGRKG